MLHKNLLLKKKKRAPVFSQEPREGLPFRISRCPLGGTRAEQKPIRVAGRCREWGGREDDRGEMTLDTPGQMKAAEVSSVKAQLSGAKLERMRGLSRAEKDERRWY